MTRFGKISRFGKILQLFGDISMAYLVFGNTMNMLCEEILHLGVFYCRNWPNIEKLSSHPVTLTSPR